MKPREATSDGKLYCCCGNCGMILNLHGWMRDNKPLICEACKKPIEWDDYLNEEDESQE